MKPYTKRLAGASCNCVIYARKDVKSLPFWLWTLADKKKIINSKKPKVGDVAIMDVGMFGHVGVVKYVGRNHVTIHEGNYQTCRTTERHNTPEALKIVGYFDPHK